MLPSAALSSSTSMSEEASASSETRPQEALNPVSPFSSVSPQPYPKKKRNQPGNPDPDAEVVAMSPKSLMATNRFVCEICSKGFQRDQNLQLHRRGHNLPWRLRQSGSGKEAARKRVYVCPEPSCVHHHPSRALGDLTGIKKHFCRKHGEKKWKCDKCSKKYAVYSDWKAHAKTCGSREYRCDCGTLFSRKDSFITHRAFCDALAEESARLVACSNPAAIEAPALPLTRHPLLHSFPSSWNPSYSSNPNLVASLPISDPSPSSSTDPSGSSFDPTQGDPFQPLFSSYHISGHHPQAASPQLSATALLQRAASVGHLGTAASRSFDYQASTSQSVDRLTHNFLGVDSCDLPGEQLMPDVFTAGSASDGRSGDCTKPAERCGYPPVTGAWSDC